MVSMSRRRLCGQPLSGGCLIGLMLIWGFGVWEASAITLTPTLSPTGPTPSPTGPTATPIPTPESWVTRTPCPSPPPTATPVCTSNYRGPFYRVADGETSLTVEISQPFRLDLEVFHQSSWCGSNSLGSHFQYDPQVVELQATIPEPYSSYDGPMCLYFQAIGAGTTDVGVVYEKTPPEFVSLLQVTVEMTTPTATFTPVPTATPTPTPIPPPTPQLTCTPCYHGPFYECSTRYKEVKVGETVSVILTVEDDLGGCCRMNTNAIFYYPEWFLRLLTRHTLGYCSPPQEEWVFQALRPGTGSLTVYYDLPWWNEDALTTIRILPTPVDSLWLSH